jgi:hypothetical protein
MVATNEVVEAIRANNMIARRGAQVFSTIRVVKINGVSSDEFDLLFRCQSSREGQPSWTEKVIVDAIKTSAVWCRNLNISSKIFNWYRNDTLQMNSFGYPIRLFHIHFNTTFNEENVLQLLLHLCETVSSCPGNNEQLILNVEDLYWENGTSVWSDVIGVSNALNLIVMRKGRPYPGFYEENEDFILRYVRREDVTDLEAVFAAVR